MPCHMSTMNCVYGYCLLKLLLLAILFQALMAMNPLKVLVNDTYHYNNLTEGCNESSDPTTSSLAFEASHPSTVVCVTLTAGLRYVNRTKADHVELCVLTNTSVSESIAVSGLSSLYIVSSRETVVNGTCHTAERGSDCRAGSILFSNITNLTIEHTKFIGFGHYTSDAFYCRSGIVLQYIKTIVIRNIEISYGVGGGLCVGNTTGTFFLAESNFTNNTHHKKVGTGGLWILTDEKSCTYEIHDCNFTNNTGHHGGGLQIKIAASGNVTITINHTIFFRNKATYGGGAAIVVNQYPRGEHMSMLNSTVTIIDCYFTNNTAKVGSHISNGGGLQLAFLAKRQANISITVTRTHFKFNKAYFGGGTSITSMGKKRNETVTFVDCCWHYNTATSGAAVDVSRIFTDTKVFSKIYLTPVFENCHFINNKVKDDNRRKEKKRQPNLLESIGQGVFSISLMRVNFTKGVLFRNNTGSALAAANTEIVFDCPKGARFKKNVGINGGAMSLEAFSILNIANGTKIFFEQNQALLHGGAIYLHISSDHMIFTTSACPFSRHINAKNVTVQLHFTNNTAKLSGNDMYFTSLLPCRYQMSHSSAHPIRADQVFSDNTTFIFNSYNESNIATAPSNYSPPADLTVQPGEYTYLDIKLQDDFGQDITHNVYFWVFEFQAKRKLKYAYSQNAYNILDKKVPIKGNTTRLLLQTVDKPLLNIVIPIVMLGCPPGYLPGTKGCECKKEAFFRVRRCTEGEFKTYMQAVTWVGYVWDEHKNESVFVSGLCHWFCKYSTKNESIPKHKPAEDNDELLSKYICKEYRRGVLCSECFNETTTSFNHHICIHNSKCKYGWLYLILTDFLPLTIMILVVMIFKINLASGNIQGFLLYSHIITTLAVYPSSKNEYLYDTLYYTLRIFYFGLDLQLYKAVNPFCIHEGATDLTNQTVAYSSIVYSIFLIFIVVVFMRCINVRFRNFNRFIRFTTIKGSAVHGLLALFLLSYTKCLELSLVILQPSILYKKHIKIESTRAFLYGKYAYFGKEHLFFAIPAIIVLIGVLIPTVALFTYPIIVKLQLRYSIELRYPKTSYALSKLFMHNTLKPFYDLFYSSFRDEHRYFAGLYLFYRIPITMTYFLPQEFDSIVTKEALLICFLAIHAIVQPYTKRSHNVIDSLLLLDLTLINGITTVVKLSMQGNIDIVPWKKILFSVFQVIAVILPCLIAIGHTCYYYIAMKCWNWVRGRHGYTKMIESSLMHYRPRGSSDDFTKYE